MMTTEVATDRDVEARAAGDVLAAIYHGAARSMADLPVYNAALEVAVVGFHARDDHALGVVVTPWFMNLVRLPLDRGGSALRQGTVVTRMMPAGALEFTVGVLDGLGPIESCSLFSPMFAFSDQPAAEQAAEAALVAVLASSFMPSDATAAARAPPAAGAALDRRRLLRGDWTERRP